MSRVMEGEYVETSFFIIKGGQKCSKPKTDERGAVTAAPYAPTYVLQHHMHRRRMTAVLVDCKKSHSSERILGQNHAKRTTQLHSDPL